MRERLFRRLTLIARFWWLFYGMGLSAPFLWLLLGWNAKRPSIDAAEINYLSVYFALHHGSIATILTLGALGVGGVLFGLKRRSIWQPLALWGMTTAALVALFLFIPVNAPNDSILMPADVTEFEVQSADPEVTHAASWTTSGRVYHLLRYLVRANPWVYRYNLYECDRLSLHCTLVYRGRYPTYEEFLANLRYPPQLGGSMNTIFLFLSGKLAYLRFTS
jgi:hypothetical protein